MQSGSGFWDRSLCDVNARSGCRQCKVARRISGLRTNSGGHPACTLPWRAPVRSPRTRTRLFALAVRAFCKTLPSSDEAQEAARQLRRAANSVRSNYRASRKGRSRLEFEAKLGTALEEADECVDWLEYLRDTRIAHDARLLDEANQITSILTASLKTSRANTLRLKHSPNS